MKSKEAGWKTVSNTVADRMIDFSLIHTLVPRRRLRRRTKAMNTAIKQFHHLKTYSQYVKMKTSILRNLSDDSEIDDTAGFTENDHSTLCRSNLSSVNCTTHPTLENPAYFCESEFDLIDGSVTSFIINENPSPQVSRSNSTKAIHLGWQEVIKKRRKNTHSFVSKNTKEKFLNSTPSATVAMGNCEFFAKGPSIGKFEEEKNKKAVKITDNIVPVEEVTRRNVELREGTNTVACQSMKHTKKNLTSLFNNNVYTAQHSIKSDIHTEAHPSLCSPDWTHESSQDKKGCVDEKNDEKFLCISSSLTGSTYQPKDSGIEEDTEEELSETKKTIHENTKYNCQEVELTVYKGSFALDDTNNFFKETNSVTLDDNFRANNDSVSNSKSIENIDIPKTEEVDNAGGHHENIEKKKIQPKITGTEIVNKKYIIVPPDNAVQNDCRHLDESNTEDACNQETLETSEIGNTENMENSISPSTERRLQQLRRLNLTVDSDSSLSENDDDASNTENMRDKLFKRSRESSDVSDQENQSINSEYTVSMQCSINLQVKQNCPDEKYLKQKSLHPSMLHKGDMKEEQTHKQSPHVLNHPRPSDNSCMHTPVCFTKESVKATASDCKDISQNVLKNSTHCSISKGNDCLENHNFRIKGDKAELIDRCDGTVTNIQAANKNAMIQERPCNLQELIEQESLVPEPFIPSIKYKDLNDDAIFLLDIPSAVLGSELLGQKIVLTQESLKLGKQKYKLTYKDVDHISCVFGTGKFGEPFQTVSIKPVARIVAHQRIIESSFTELPNQPSNSAENYAKSIDKVKTNVLSTKIQSKRKQKLTFKKKR